MPRCDELANGDDDLPQITADRRRSGEVSPPEDLQKPNPKIRRLIRSVRRG